MRDIATATLSGNLTRDVELRELPSGTDVARLRVATTTRRRSGEEWVDQRNYFTVEVFVAQARSCAEYLRKGSRVFVDAELDWREWTDKHDNKREAVTFRARQVLFEGGRSASARSADDASEQKGASPEAATIGDGELAAVSAPSGERSSFSQNPARRASTYATRGDTIECLPVVEAVDSLQAVDRIAPACGRGSSG
jgi:single-strand DNA-binding protein